jgi:hypothetical protein
MTDNGHQVGESGQVEGLSWNNYQIGVHFEHDQDSRRAKYYLQDVITEKILPTESRLALCLKRARPGQSVKVVYSNKAQRSHYKDVIMCGSVWGCPICSGYITDRRRKELASALDVWSGSVLMGAFTVQHRRGDKLAEVKSMLFDAYRDFTAGRGWQDIKARYAIAGNVIANEVTWSEQNGWHPHRHVLFFMERVLTEQEIVQFETDIKERFYGIVKSKGGYSSMEWGVKVTTGEKHEASAYVFKWGLDYEMLSWNKKQADGGGYGPFELADLYGRYGEQQYKMLFKEYYQAFKGTKRVQYSKGLKQRLKLEQESDKEVLKEVGQDEQLAGVLSWDAYKIVGQKHRRGELLEVMTALIRGTIKTAEVVNFLLELGMRVSNYDDGVVMIRGLLERDNDIHGIGEFDIDVGQLLEHIEADDRMRLTGEVLQEQTLFLKGAIEHNRDAIEAVLDLYGQCKTRGELQTLSEWYKEISNSERWLEHKFDILKERHHNYLAECIMLGAMVGAVQDRKLDRT